MFVSLINARLAGQSMHDYHLSCRTLVIRAVERRLGPARCSNGTVKAYAAAS